MLQNGLTGVDEISDFDTYGTQGPTNGQNVQDVREKLSRLIDNVSNRSTATTTQNSAIASALKEGQAHVDALRTGEPISAQVSRSLEQYSGVLDTLSAQQFKLNAPARKALTATKKATTQTLAAQKPATPTAGLAKFGSTVDFNIVLGLSGGPNWTLTYFKGPAGSSGPLSFSRTYFDTLAIAFVATCQREELAPDAATYWATLPQCSVYSKSDAIAQGNALIQSMELKPLLQLGLPGALQ